MDQSAISVRYAKAFFKTAKENKLIGPLKSDIEMVFDLCQQSKDFILLLESPVIKSTQKASVLKAIFDGKLHQFTLNFLLLVVQNKREVYIPGICRNFLDIVRREENIRQAIVATAAPISKNILSDIEKTLAKELNATIELQTKVNPDLIGGMVLRIDDIQFDASVATQLKKIKHSLLKTEL